MQINERGNFATVTMLDDVTLTDDFDDNTSEPMRLSPLVRLELIADYTENGSETNNNILIKILLSEDGDKYREYSIAQDGSPSGGLVKRTLHSLEFVIPGTPGSEESRWFAIATSAKWMKVAVLEEGLSAPGEGGQATIKLRISNEAESL